jgi:hypothetical protein
MKVTTKLFDVLVDLFKLSYGDEIGEIDEIYFQEIKPYPLLRMFVIYTSEEKTKVMECEITFFYGDDMVKMRKIFDIEIEKKVFLYRMFRTDYRKNFTKYERTDEKIGYKTFTASLRSSTIK